MLTDELADLRSSYHAARFPVRGRSRIAPEKGEITPANGWETNDDRLPGFLIPGPHGDKVVAPYIKRTPEGMIPASRHTSSPGITCVSNGLTGGTGSRFIDGELGMW